VTATDWRQAAPGVSGRPTSRRLIVVSVVSVTVAIAFGRFSYPLVLPALKKDLLRSYSIAGFLGSCGFAAYLASSVFVTMKGSRLAPGQLIRWGVAGTAFGLLVLASAGSVWWLGAGMVITGASGALVWIAAPGLAANAVPPDRRGWTIGLLATGIGVGVVASGQLAAVSRGIESSVSWRLVWGIQAVLASSCFVLVLASRRVTVGPAERAAAAMRALRTVPGWAGVTVAYTCYGLSYSLFVSYLVTMLEDDAEYTASHSSHMFAVLGLATVGAAVIGRLSDRFGRLIVLASCLVAMAVAALTVLMGSEPWTTFAAASFGWSMSGVPVVVAAYVADEVPPDHFSSAFGAATLAFGIAQFTGPLLGGTIADHTGSFIAVYVLSSVTALSAASGAIRASARTRRT
jgi:predicted MFS family arabinose efflux permease